MQSSFTAWGNGLLGVLIFSGSLPATRMAVGGFSPLFLTSARAVLAALIGGLVLIALSGKRPSRGDALPLMLVALGVVVGFPLLTAIALQEITAAHSTVFIGLLPLATAIFGVLRGGERPRPLFWAFSCAGALAVALFALREGGSALLAGDLLMLAAILVCGYGYAEGARLARHLGGWQVICWALVFSLPPMLALALLTHPPTLAGIAVPAWVGLGYVSVFSMLVGFFFWYRGLALGGIAGVGQLQLLQPFFGLLLAGWLLGEAVVPSMIAVSGFVVACVVGARRYA